MNPNETAVISIGLQLDYPTEVQHQDSLKGSSQKSAHGCSVDWAVVKALNEGNLEGCQAASKVLRPNLEDIPWAGEAGDEGPGAGI